MQLKTYFKFNWVFCSAICQSKFVFPAFSSEGVRGDVGHLALSGEATQTGWISGAFVKSAPDGQTLCLLVCLAAESIFHEYTSREVANRFLLSLAPVCTDDVAQLQTLSPEFEHGNIFYP
jgi:hypothetical protein